MILSADALTSKKAINRSGFASDLLYLCGHLGIFGERRSPFSHPLPSIAPPGDLAKPSLDLSLGDRPLAPKYDL